MTEKQEIVGLPHPIKPNRMIAAVLVSRQSSVVTPPGEVRA